MEFGVVMGMEGLVGGGNSGNGNGGGNGSFSSTLIASENTDSRRQKVLSGFSATASLKQGRTGGGGVTEVQDWRSPKMARTETTVMQTEKAHFSLSSSSSSCFPKSTSNSHSLFPGGQQHMLSFSSSKQDTSVLCSDGNLPSYNHHNQAMSSTSAASSVSNTGLGRNMHGVLAGFRGCFTPNQLVELEHQAMIYRFIDANVPIPPNLLHSINKSPNLSGCYSSGSLNPSPSTYGWGSFQLGFSGSSDPEPGRCRRTDGKKWRCSRDAVVDSKYCERHMNRGRHRSRKPVEGHAGHGNTMSIVTPSSTTDTSVCIGIAQTQTKNLQAGFTEPSLTQYNRMLMNTQNANNQVRDSQGLSMSIPTSPSACDIPPLQKHSNRFEHSSDQMGFLPSSYVDNRSSANSPDFCDQETQPQLLHNLFGILPQNHSDNSTITWHELEAINTARTQLSISIPMTPTCFSLSSSTAVEKLKSPQELDPTVHIGLGIGAALDDVNQHRQENWAPLSWGASTGGPLGEVLNSTNNLRDRPESNSSSPNLAGDWDSSPRLDSSPTGVLQKTALGSHSSSTGSSPRADNHRSQEIPGNLCDDRHNSSHAISTPIPSL